jgi:hypothetical protein
MQSSQAGEGNKEVNPKSKRSKVDTRHGNIRSSEEVGMVYLRFVKSYGERTGSQKKTSTQERGAY